MNIEKNDSEDNGNKMVSGFFFPSFFSVFVFVHLLSEIFFLIYVAFLMQYVYYKFGTPKSQYIY